MIARHLKSSLTHSLLFAFGFVITHWIISPRDTEQKARARSQGHERQITEQRREATDTATISITAIPEPRDLKGIVELAARTAGPFAFAASYSEWVRKEPNAALEWIQQRQYLLERSPEISKTVAQAILESRTDTLDAVAGFYPTYQSALIRETFLLLPDSELPRYAGEFSQRLVATQLLSAVAKAWGERDAESALAWLASSKFEVDTAESLVADVMLGLSTVDPETALQWSLQRTANQDARTAKEIFRATVRTFGTEAAMTIALDSLAVGDDRLSSLVDAARSDLIKNDPVEALSLGFAYGSEITRNVTLCAAYDAAPDETKRWLSDTSNAQAANSVLLGLAIQEATKGDSDAMELLQFIPESDRPSIARQIVYSWRPLLDVSDIRTQIANSPFLDSNAKALLTESADRPLLGLESRWLASKESANATHP